ncbi:sulfotransferase family 2 domain-containing protein [Thiocapsa bogorovii]|uniref:sulfotransferase family 2 domain-containing protein n=1 Tax=Thiocapsa bogorovii TaxID=521689 RepID=UPI001E592DE5|nr:sulfotransferase family 2 domain-containing protein [Thiocapsa bogorovii]UHD14548.1 sulfotransferase family protein [Thiocapsa bogorovii]
MIISNSKDFIFIHTHKCAGSTITDLLSPYSCWNDIELGVSTLGETLQGVYQQRFGLWKHSAARDVRNVLGDETFRAYFKFGFVRNPFFRVISFYTFITKLHRTVVGANKEIIDTWPISKAFRESADFSEFIRHSAFVEPSMTKLLAEPYGESFRLLVDYVGRVEHFDRDIVEVFQRIGLPPPECISPRNTSSNELQRLHQFYSSEDDLAVVYENYRSDFEIFGYSLEDAEVDLRRPRS